MTVSQLRNAIMAVVVAVGIGLLAGQITQERITQETDSCSVAALEAVLDGGTLQLEDDCIIMLDQERIISGDVLIEGGMLHSGGLDRVLTVAQGADVTLRRVTVISGTIELEPKFGGGIYNMGTLLLDHSRVISNRAQQGGGIYNSGHLTVIASEIARNGAREGGGIYNRGTLVIDRSRISENGARADTGEYGGYGAGIVNKGEARITRSTISDNRASSEGAGIDSSGTLTIQHSSITNNTCTGAACRGSGLLRFEGDVIATHNYWGAADGPGEDGPGSGDGVVNLPAAAYTPWLESAPEWE